MQRRKFLQITTAATPAILVGNNIPDPGERTAKGFVIKANESRFDEKTMLGGKSPNNIKVSAKDTGSALTIFEYIGHEKGGPPLHLHHKQDEIFFIVEGEYLFKVGEDTYTLKSGDTIFLPRKVPHAFAQLTDHGKMFFMFQPSGKMEDFFRKVGAAMAPPTPAEGAKLFAAHEMLVVGPPLQF
ncbi:Cupin domain-containing protein [Chitinophaga dinghuensis]|uniref:Cupin domain-containing protein n=1 Tax=Chitinophaga dinghuensis TaxID=1539050 RepID=A0A327VYU6_9BACT|nr:cupin domain-containing protein [Chitinophaga dinghuensis]RAJ80065.1 Cupin domain-containing protein [Chitinophaga dinghuensis]